MTKCVSVVIPVYNGFKWVELIKSSIASNINMIFEVILVNDGDFEDYRRLSEFLKKKFPHLIVKASSGYRSGPAMARNRGIELARGEYVAFHDADDTWLPHSLEKRVALLKAEPNAPFAYSGLNIVNESHAVLSHILVPAKAMVEDILVTNFICTSSVIGKTKILKGHQFRNVGHEDLDLWLRLIHLANYPAVGLNDRVVNLQVGHSSVSSNKFYSLIWHFNIIKNYLRGYAFPLLPFLILAYSLNGISKRKMREYRPFFFGLNTLLTIVNGAKNKQEG